MGPCGAAQVAATAAAKSLHSCPTLCDPIDGSPPGSPFPRILQLLLLLLSRFSRVQLCDPIGWQPTRLPRPWDSPGKSTGVGRHFLLQHMKVKSESEVAQSCLTLSDPMDYSLPGSSVHGIFQARVLEWGAIAFSKRNNSNSKYLSRACYILSTLLSI